MRTTFLVVAALAFGGGFFVGSARAGQAAPETAVTGCNDGSEEVGRRRRPRPNACEECPGRVKICCPDCSTEVGKACVCDCHEQKCACR
ncbi:MAG: hypothetical protein HY904_21580 [Deltaproteobacteria bacterium]|nr:hypothetical protein [Deltaproteobacteria bacterium]